MQQTKFDRGLAYHKSGQLAQAKALYLETLSENPRHYDCLHLLGVIASQTGRHAEAVDLIDKAIALNPSNAVFYSNRGNALQGLRRFEDAVASYDQAIALNPSFVQAYNNLGNALKSLKRLDAALASFDRAILVKPDYAEAYCNRGVTLAEIGRLDDAVLSYDQAIAIKPDYAEAYSNRGNALRALNLLAAALASFDQALALKQAYAEAYSNRGAVLLDLKRIDSALADFERAIALKPDYAEAYSNRGNALKELGQLDAALSSYEKSLELNPSSYETHANRGNVLAQLKQREDAVLSYDRATAINPGYAEAYCYRGNALRDLGKLDEAVAAYDKAISLKRDYAEAYLNRGVVLQQQQRVEGAIESFDQAIGVREDYAEAYLNKSIALLLSGDFDAGWKLYEWRFVIERAVGIGRDFGVPDWRGQESLLEKRILLHCEQGLGDTIQFCRYAELVASMGAQVILEVQKPLLRLMRTLRGVAELVELGAALPSFDFHCPLLSLPLAFRTTLNTIPASLRYLSAEPDRAARWKSQLGDKRARLRVGLVWAGGYRANRPELWAAVPESARIAVNERRNIALERLSMLRQLDVELISLQIGQPAESELIQWNASGGNGPRVLDVASQLEDFADTAALIENLDLVVSVDTSVAHLAAALGKPVWLLNRFDTCWRWLLNREDSPWYPAMKIYRQQRFNDWSGVAEAICADLAKGSL